MEGNYTVSYEKDQGSIQFLYDLTDIFLRPIIDGNLFPDGFLTPEKYPDIDSLGNLPDDIIDNYEDVINQNMNFISAVAFGIVFSILSFFVFFGLCCNQCCCTPPKRKQNDKGNKKIAWMVLTFLFLVFGYLGVAWMSVSSAQMEREAKGLSEDMNDILHDGDLFMNLTIDEIEDVVDGIVVIADEEIQNINVQFDIFVDKLLDDIQLNELKVRVADIVELFDNQTLIVEDVNGVISVQTEIILQLGVLTTDCEDLFSSTPDLCNPLSTISAALGDIKIEEIPEPNQDLVNDIHDIGDLFNDVTAQIENIDISQILSQLSDEVNSISDFVSDELSSVDDIQEKIFRSNSIPSKMDDIYNNYLKYVNTGFLSIGGFLAFILTFVLIGLACGVPQKSSKCGSWTMCSALSIFFIAAIFLFLICMALFVVGAFTQKLVCDTLNEPENSEMIPLIDMFLNDGINSAINLSSAFNLSVPVIISGVHQGLPVYPLLQLNIIYDIDELSNWRVDFNIDSIIDSTLESIDAVISDVTDMESEIVDQEAAVTNLAKALDEELNPILDKLLDETQINEPILQSREQLNNFINSLPDDQPEISSFVDSLNELSSEMGYLEGNITTVQEDFSAILDTFGVDDDNGNRDLALKIFVEETFQIVESAFDIFPGKVETFVSQTIEDLLGAVDEEIPNIIESVNTVGGTLPLSNIYNATYTHVCLEMVSPLNSVWSGLGWTLLLILFPLSLFSCLLMRILRQDVSSHGMRPYQARTRNISMHDLSPPTYNLAVKPVNQYSQNPHYHNGNGQQENRNYNNNMRKY